MATAIALIFAGLAMGGLVYAALALLGARSFARALRVERARAATALASGGSFPGSSASGDPFLPGVSVLKPLKGVDARMMDALRSHCRQSDATAYELIFGVNAADDPAVAVVAELRREFPGIAMDVVVSTGRLGANGKVSNLIQMERRARYPFVLVNDGDISVGPNYLAGVMRGFRDARVGMVTALYRGQTIGAGKDVEVGSGDRVQSLAALQSGIRLGSGSGALPRVSVWAKLEALGISTDFAPGVLTARMLEGGIRFGLGSTLAMRREALAAAGGFAAVVDVLADDYELGRRIAAAGYRVELAGEVVETTVPAYTARGFREHQMRWARTVRDSRRWGYVGLGVTFVLPWALAACVASGVALWSLALLSLALVARVAVALSVGVGVLGDRQVLRDLWLLPVRDCVGLVVWLWSFAGDTVVWRGERFRLRAGRLEAVGE